MKRTGWQRGLDDALNGLVTVGDILMVFVQTIIVAFGTLAILMMLLIVEVHAVSLGIQTFEADMAFARLAAGVLVLLNLSVKFQEVYADYIASDLRVRYQPPKHYAPSLRSTLGGLAYWLGIGKGWEERELPASHNFAVTRRWITIAILAIAFIGRTETAITKISVDTVGGNVAWNVGVQNLLTQSSLADMAEWVAALVFTFVVVVASQQLTQYVAVRVLDIRRGLRTRVEGVTVERASAPSADFPKLKPVVMSALSAADGQRTDSGQAANGYTKKMDARTIVWTHLEGQPDAASLPVRELAAMLNVGRTTVSEVVREWKSTKG